MRKPETQNHAARSARGARRWLLLSLVGVAVFFRFYALDRKVFWHDEVFTSLAVAGYTVEEVNRQLPPGSVVTAADLQRLQRINPNRNALSVISSLAADTPEHPPLYFVMARLWAEVFGDSVSSLRALSAVIGVLVLPCVFWLSRELFAPERAAWVAVVAVSPFQVLYAQEARQYSLLAVVILSASAALLRAGRRQSRADWLVYAACLAAGLYTHPLFALVVLAHGLYTAVTNLSAVINAKPPRLTPTLKGYALATLLGCAAFAPWLVNAQAHLSVGEVGSWFDESIGVSKLLKRWLFDFGALFLDTAGPNVRSLYGVNSRLIDLAHVPVVMLEGFALYALCRRGERRAAVFVLSLAASTFLALAVPDLILGGQRSGVPRYMMATDLALQLAVAYFFALRMTGEDGGRGRRWEALFLLIILVGVASCAVSSQASAWWNKGDSSRNIRAAPIINAAADPLVVSDFSGYGFANTLSLGRLLAPGTRLQLTTGRDAPPTFPPAGTVFLFGSSEATRRGIEGGGRYRVEQTGEPALWRLVPK